MNQETVAEDIVTSPVADLDFTDHKQAFKEKSLWEIVRALTVFRVCSDKTFASRSAEVMCYILSLTLLYVTYETYYINYTWLY